MSTPDLRLHARRTAEQWLTPVGHRWDHVHAVGRLAESIAWHVEPDADTLVASAYLHDIGYAPDLAVTGFHPLDGARATAALGFPEDVACLVAHHSGALIEARLRGLDQELVREFRRRDDQVADALCYCDMVTGPSGDRVTIEERLEEIRQRYGRGSVVTTFIDEAFSELVATVRRVEARLSAAGADQPM